MPPRHVRSYSDFYRHGRRSSPVVIKKKPKLQKVRHSSDSAVLSVSRKRSKSSYGLDWRRVKRWGIALIVFGWVALPLYAPYFRVKDIVLENFPSNIEMKARQLAHDTIEPSWFFVPKNNYFIVNTDNVKAALAERFRTAENISVTKKFPNQLVISATEKPPAIIYDDGKDYYFLDQEGNMLRQIAKVEEGEYDFLRPKNSIASTSTSSSSDLPEDNPSSAVRVHTPAYKKISGQFGLYPIIYDNRKNIVVGDTAMLPTSTIKAVVSWNHWMLDTKLASVKYFTIEDNLNAGMKMFTDKKWYVNFQPNNDNLSQFNNFRIVLQNASPKPTEYIDVRFSRANDWKTVFVK